MNGIRFESESHQNWLHIEYFFEHRNNSDTSTPANRQRTDAKCFCVCFFVLKYYVYDFYVSSADINTNLKLINVIAPSNIKVFKKEITPKQWRITLKIKTSAKKGSLKQYVKIVTDLPNKPVILFSINQKTNKITDIGEFYVSNKKIVN